VVDSLWLTGSEKAIVQPFPLVPVAVIFPSWAVIIRFETASPRPVPTDPFEVTKSSKIALASSLSIPIPSSLTVTIA